MEAVPRLPMLKFDSKLCVDERVYTNPLKRYIRNHYNEDPDNYITELQELEALRTSVAFSREDCSFCGILRKYFCQIRFLLARFPINQTNSDLVVTFHWKDVYSPTIYEVADVQHEQAGVLYNIAVYHMSIGAAENRSSPDGMRNACTHFQCAAWAFQYVRDTFPQSADCDLSPNLMGLMHTIALAQAQECILEKSITDNRKPSIIAKVAMQVVEYLRAASRTLESSTSTLHDIVGSKRIKAWSRYCQLKQTYYHSVTQLYQGLQAEELQRMGDRLAYLIDANDKLSAAAKLAKGMDGEEVIRECLTFSNDVMGGKLTAAQKENEFVFHEKVPDVSALPEVKGASLVKGIPFSFTDTDTSGPDIFRKLIPMEAHQASSMYSEEKASLLRGLGSRMQDKNDELEAFLASLQLEDLLVEEEADTLPQELVAACADLNSRNALQELDDLLNRVSAAHLSITQLMDEHKALLEEEEQKADEYRAAVGEKKAPATVLTELRREADKYRNALTAANESDLTLRAAAAQLRPALATLAQPLPQVTSTLPSVVQAATQAGGEGGSESKAQLQRLMKKVEEMQQQRWSVEKQLRQSLMDDDITGQLVTAGQETKEMFKEQLKKHDHLVEILEQNMVAQSNILSALSESNAAYASTRRATQQCVAARTQAIQGLLQAFDSFNAILSKSRDAQAFYDKLFGQVTKLLKRTKSVISVQEEERQEKLAAQAKKYSSTTRAGGKGALPTGGATSGYSDSSYSAHASHAPLAPPADSSGGGLKLKDFLQAGGGFKSFSSGSDAVAKQPPSVPTASGYYAPTGYSTSTLSAQNYPVAGYLPSTTTYGSATGGSVAGYHSQRSDAVSDSNTATMAGYPSNLSTTTSAGAGIPPNQQQTPNSTALNAGNHGSPHQSPYGGSINNSQQQQPPASFAPYQQKPHSTYQTPAATQGLYAPRPGAVVSSAANAVYPQYSPSAPSPVPSPAPQSQQGLQYSQPPQPQPITAQSPQIPPQSQQALPQTYQMPTHNQPVPQQPQQMPGQTRHMLPQPSPSSQVSLPNQQPAMQQYPMQLSTAAQYSGVQAPYSAVVPYAAAQSFAQPAATQAPNVAVSPLNPYTQPSSHRLPPPAPASTTAPNSSYQSPYPVAATSYGGRYNTQYASFSPGYPEVQYPASQSKEGAYSNYTNMPTSNYLPGYEGSTAFVPNQYPSGTGTFTPSLSVSMGRTTSVLSHTASSTYQTAGSINNIGTGTTASATTPFMSHGAGQYAYPGSTPNPTPSRTVPDEDRAYYRYPTAAYIPSYHYAQAGNFKAGQGGNMTPSSVGSPVASPGFGALPGGPTAVSAALTVAGSGLTANGVNSVGETSQPYPSVAQSSYAAQYPGSQYSAEQYSYTPQQLQQQQQATTLSYYPQQQQQQTMYAPQGQHQSPQHSAVMLQPQFNQSGQVAVPRVAVPAAQHPLPSQTGLSAANGSTSRVQPVQTTSSRDISNLDLLSGIELAGPSSMWTPLTPITPTGGNSTVDKEGSQPQTTTSTISNNVINGNNAPDVTAMAGLNLSAAAATTNGITLEKCTASVVTLDTEPSTKTAQLDVIEKSSSAASETTGDSTSPQINTLPAPPPASSLLELAALAQLQPKPLAAGGIRLATDPLDDPSTLEGLVGETERLHKTVETLHRRSLNGPTNLEIKWKEIQDAVEVRCKKTTVSVGRCYPVKNRFPDILPYDHSRVVLTSTKDDYINASYVTMEGPFCFPVVVSQAPTAQTAVDYWQMVWQLQTELIVCLHTLPEMKNWSYWPSGKGSDQAVQFGSLTVTEQNSGEGGGGAWRQRLLHLTNSSGTTRAFIHLQFMDWPPGGVPSSPNALLALCSEALSLHSQQRNKQRPLLFTCMPGIGRSCVTAILVMFLSQLRKAGSLSDLQTLCVETCAARRGGLQDKDYLRFLYSAALYAAQDTLMKRGILTNKATFEEGPREKSHHVRHPSADLLAANCDFNRLKSKLGLDYERSDASSEDGSPATRPSGSSSPEPVAPSSTIVPPLLSALENTTVSGDASPHLPATSLSSLCGLSLPPNLAASIDPMQLKIDPVPPGKGDKITKESFERRGSSGLSARAQDPDDPFSTLDPLWTLKKS